MKYYLLPESMKNELIAYLATRPYREVADEIPKLIQLETIDRPLQMVPDRPADIPPFEESR